MNRIVLVSALALTLAGCNATVRPAVDVYVPAPPRQHVEYYAPVPMARPYYEPARPRIVLPPSRPRCATVWQNTPRGYVERQVCGNHIP
jgi:hypothetical protein